MHPLLPDLRMYPPYQIAIDTADPTAPGRQELVFSTSAINVGTGPLIVDGHKTDPTTAVDMTASQALELSNGQIAAGAVPNVGSIYFDEGHYHWHLRAFERYTLHAERTDAVVAPDSKRGFCLGDRFKITTDYLFPNQPPNADPGITGDCHRGDLTLTSIREGISPGWGDDYPAQLEGQYVDITHVPAGRYYLTVRVDPLGRLRVAAQDDQSASALVSLSRRSPTATPTVSVLASCPFTARCEPRQAPRVARRPTVVGARVGHMARCMTGRWSGRPVHFYFQWVRGGVPRPGAIHNTYLPTSQDAGRPLACQVVAANAAATGKASSTAVPVVAGTHH